MKPSRPTLSRLALALLPLLPVGHAHGELFWVGPISGSWADASNWSGGVLPDSADRVFLGRTEVEVLGTQAADFISSDGKVLLRDSAASLSFARAQLLSLAISAGRYASAGGTAAQELTWMGGRLEGASVTSVSGPATVGGLTVLGAGHTLNLSGSTRLQGALSFESNAIVVNRGHWLDAPVLGRTLQTVPLAGEVQNDLLITGDFDNRGVYTKDGAGATTFGEGLRLHNSGSLSVQGGRLSLLGGSSSGGSVTIQSGATLELGRAGVYSANHSLSGPVDNRGRLLLSGGVVQADAGLQLLGVTELDGSLLNLGADSSFAALTLRSGQLATARTVSVNSLAVAGDVTVRGGVLRSNVSFINSGRLTLSDGAELQSPLPALTNQGVLAGTGIVRVAGSLNNLGVLAPGSEGAIGTLQVVGNLLNAGAVHIDLASGAADQLNVSGQATLGGTLSFGIAGGQRLRRGDSFAVMSWGSRVAGSEFASLDFSQASGYRFTSAYGATGLTVTVASAPFVWTGPATGGTWEVVKHWNDGTDGLPQAGDTVLLGAADTRIRSSVSVSDVTGTGSLSVEAAGRLVLSGTGSVGGLQLRSGGQLTNLGRLVATDASSWVGAVLRGAGVTRIEGAFTIAGNLFDSSPILINGHTLELAGTTTYAGQRGLSVGDGSTLVNQGTWVDQSLNDVTFSNGNGGTGRFVNTGTFTKASSTRTLIGEGSALDFENTGTLNVDAGYLRLSGSRVNSTGNLNIAAGAELSLRSANATLGGRVVNDGSLSFDGGVVTLAGDVTLQGSGQTQLKGTINNTGGFVIEGNTDWIEANLAGSGSTRMNGAVTLSSSSNHHLTGGQTLTLAGTTTQTGTGSLSTGGGARVVNLGSWVEAANGNVSLGNFSGGVGSRFDNVGSFTKTSTFVTNIGSGLNFNNTGLLDVQAGTLRFTDNATLAAAGQVRIAAGATLDLVANQVLLAGTVQNAGTLVLTGGTLAVTDTAAVLGAGQTVLRGTLQNSGQLLLAGSTEWGPAVLRGSGTTRIEGPLTITGASGRGLIGHTLELAGNTQQTGTGSINTGSAARLVNLGTWTEAATGAASIGNFSGGAASRFDNAGTLVKTSAFVTDIGNGVVLNNTGTMRVEAGTLRLSHAFNNQGSIEVAAGAVLASSVVDFANAGTLGGDGTVRTASAFANLINTGTLAAGGLNDAGTLTLVGGLTQQAGGTFLVDLGGTAAGSFDLLTVSSSAVLGGTLAVNVLPGAHFNVGDGFTVLTWSQRPGNTEFTSLDLSQAGGYGFATEYGANSLTLRVTAAAPVPEPGSWALMAAGLLGLGALRRRACAVRAAG